MDGQMMQKSLLATFKIKNERCCYFSAINVYGRKRAW